MFAAIVIAVVLILLAFLLIANVRIVPQATVYVIAAGSLRRHLGDGASCKNTHHRPDCQAGEPQGAGGGF